jgi:hypothetical protein
VAELHEIHLLRLEGVHLGLLQFPVLLFWEVGEGPKRRR